MLPWGRTCIRELEGSSEASKFKVEVGSALSPFLFTKVRDRLTDEVTQGSL